MQKLITPVQYEDNLDELNRVRPLNLTDEVKIKLDIGVLNLESVNTNRPARGKLSRCDDNSGLLVKNHAEFKYTNYVSMLEEWPVLFIPIPFLQKVFGVLWIPYAVEDVEFVYLTDSGDVVRLQNLSKTSSQWIPFSGSTLYIHVLWLTDGIISGTFYGFYN